MYSKYIYNIVREKIQENWVLECNEQEGTILVYRVGLNASINTYSTIITVREDDCLFYALYDSFSIKSDHMNKVAELLMKINGKYIYPHLLLDYEHKNVYCIYRPIISADSCDKNDVGQAFYDVGIQMQRWANAILTVSLGLQSPDDAIASVNTEE